MPNQYTYEDTPWQDEDLLRRLYAEEGRSTYDIAEEFGCSYQTVNNWLEKFDIERRSANSDKPVHLSTHESGYEQWAHDMPEKKAYVYVHRLLAVAEYGYEAVCDNDAHHKNAHPWDNRPSNIELLSREEHTSHHHKKWTAKW